MGFKELYESISSQGRDWQNEKEGRVQRLTGRLVRKVDIAGEIPSCP
jgi:hypothetical protein